MSFGRYREEEAVMRLVCISCPRGCEMEAAMEGDEVKVTGNGCALGITYATAELTCPMRTVTSSVFIDGGDCPLLSVKTKATVPKADIDKVLSDICNVHVKAPVEVGDVLKPDIGGTGVDLVATRKVRAC